MKLDCVLTACNNIPMYIDFIPNFVKAWNKLCPNVDVKIILIHDSIPEKFKEYEKNIILFPPLPNVSTAFTSQYIRLLYPALLPYTNGVMITDMDILPMNSRYYIENIKPFTNDHFVYLRHVLMEGYVLSNYLEQLTGRVIQKKITIPPQLSMCYNVATPTVWGEIFTIQTVDDINKRILEVYESIEYVTPGELHKDGEVENHSWSQDQIDLYACVMKWNTHTNKFAFIRDDNTGYRRLDRSRYGGIPLTQELQQMIHMGVFSDYHCYRPYEKFKHFNDTIVSWL